MTSVGELRETWATIRKVIPKQANRLVAFRALVEMLESAGWDQAGYLYTLMGPWPEVDQYCREENLELEDDDDRP